MGTLLPRKPASTGNLGALLFHLPYFILKGPKFPTCGFLFNTPTTFRDMTKWTPLSISFATLTKKPIFQTNHGK